MAWVLAVAFVDSFGGDSLSDLRRAVAGHRRRLRSLPRRGGEGATGRVARPEPVPALSGEPE